MKVSITELSNLTAMDRRRIRGLLADLPAVKGPKGASLYESHDALPALYCRTGESYDLTEERARLAFHQANMAARNEEILAGKYVSIEECADIVGQDYANVRARLLAIPSKAAPELAVETSTQQAFALIQKYIHDALQELTCDDDLKRRAGSPTTTAALA